MGFFYLELRRLGVTIARCLVTFVDQYRKTHGLYLSKSVCFHDHLINNFTICNFMYTDLFLLLSWYILEIEKYVISLNSISIALNGL